MGLNDTLFGKPPQTTVQFAPGFRAPGFNMARSLGDYLMGLIGKPGPEYQGNLDPGLSPTLQNLGRMMQGYGSSPAPYILGQAAGTLGQFMNPTFGNPADRLAGPAQNFFGGSAPGGRPGVMPGGSPLAPPNAGPYTADPLPLLFNFGGLENVLHNSPWTFNNGTLSFGPPLSASKPLTTTPPQAAPPQASPPQAAPPQGGSRQGRGGRREAGGARGPARGSSSSSATKPMQQNPPPQQPGSQFQPAARPPRFGGGRGGGK